jgi:RHS repeat-associated protein
MVGELDLGSPEEVDSLSPIWTERHGSGGDTITMVDSLTYDGWERVTEVRYLEGGSLVATDSLSFDAAGNLFAGNGEVYDSVTNRLTETSDCSSYSYDDSGNLTSKTCHQAVWTYTYDALERLTHVSNNAGFSVAYTYDVLGRRIAKKVDSVVTRFVWRSGHVIYETTDGGTITRSYTWGLATDDLVAIHDHDASDHYYVVQDRLRSIRGLVDRDGTWKATWRYRAYGEELSSSGSIGFPLRFRWAGAQYDEETGFYYLRARYYDPTLGRFTQEDPAGAGANLYAYVTNPVEARDPSGMRVSLDAQYDVVSRDYPHSGGGRSLSIPTEWVP